MYKNLIVSKIPKASRDFQLSIFSSTESRFQNLVQTPIEINKKKSQHHIYKAKVLLLDIKHIITYETLDYDIRQKFIKFAQSVISYIQFFLEGFQKRIAHSQ